MLSQFTLLIISTVILFTACKKKETSATTQGNVPFSSSASRSIIVLDDLDVGVLPPNVMIDTANIDTAQVVIWGTNGSMTNGTFRKNATGSNFSVMSANNTPYNVSFPTTLDTLRLSDLQLYYTLPGIMNGDTVRVLIPRPFILTLSSNGGGGTGGSGFGRN